MVRQELMELPLQVELLELVELVVVQEVVVQHKLLEHQRQVKLLEQAELVVVQEHQRQQVQVV